MSLQGKHVREMNKNRQRTNLGIGVLTIFLVVGSLLQGYSAFLTHQSTMDQVLLVLIVVIALVLGIFVTGLMAGIDTDDLKLF